MGDWSSPQYIASQVFVFLAFAALGTTFLFKKRAWLLRAVLVSSLIFMLGYGLLEAWSAVGMCAIAICRDIVSYYFDRHRKPEDKNKITRVDCIFLAVWVSAMFITTWFTAGHNFKEWFAFFASLAFVVSVWQKNILVYKFCGGVLCGCLWIAYNIFISNLTGLICESALLCSVIAGIVLYFVRNKKNQRVGGS